MYIIIKVIMGKDVFVFNYLKANNLSTIFFGGSENDCVLIRCSEATALFLIVKIIKIEFPVLSCAWI